MTAENVGGIYGTEHHWTPSQVTVSTIGGVTIGNPTTVYHGVEWISPPSMPNCDSVVPVGTTPAASAANWKGTCTFTAPGTYIYYCTVHGAAMKGTITVKAPGTPKVVTGVADKNQTTATLHGTVNPEGNPTSYYFRYGLDSKMGQKTPASPQSVGPPDFNEHSVSAELSGLEPSTPYHVELVAVYGPGTEVQGLEQTFTTPAATAPTVFTTNATVEGERKATLHGEVNPNGGKATKYFFQYGPTEGYGSSTTPVAGLPVDNASHAASASIPQGSPTEEEPKPGTIYHFRLVASNEAGGPSYGKDLTFKTASPPAPKEPPKEPPAKEPSPTPTPPTTTTTTTTTPLVEPPPGPPLAGSPSLRSSQRGTSVKGSLDVSAAGAGGRLEVDLLAKSASLAAVRRSAPVRVGRLVRASVSAGKVFFSVPLTARGKSALHRHHRLALTVKITLTPIQGAAVTITRSVVLRA